MATSKREGAKEQKECAGEHDYDPTTGAKTDLEQYDAFALVKPHV